MNLHVLRLFIVSAVSLTSQSWVAAQGQKAAVLDCYDAEVSKLISSKSRNYSSEQFRIVCQFQDISKRERNEIFTYHAPEGFKIVSADTEVILKSFQTSISDLEFHSRWAKVTLQCKGRSDDVLVHDAISVKIVGRLEYLPALQETKNLVGKCFD